MPKIFPWLAFALGAAAVLTLAANAARTDRLVFLSTQLRPIAEAQKMRNLILKDFSREVEFITEPPQGFKDYLEQNKERINGWKKTPYWVRDNPEFTQTLRGDNI